MAITSHKKVKKAGKVHKNKHSSIWQLRILTGSRWVRMKGASSVKMGRESPVCLGCISTWWSLIINVQVNSVVLWSIQVLHWGGSIWWVWLQYYNYGVSKFYHSSYSLVPLTSLRSEPTEFPYINNMQQFTAVYCLQRNDSLQWNKSTGQVSSFLLSNSHSRVDMSYYSKSRNAFYLGAVME